MGTTAQYVMISETELQEILAGGAEKFLGNLRDEHYGSNQRLKNIDNAIKQASSVTCLASFDLENMRSLMTAAAQEAFSNLKQQQALSRQRLGSADPSERINELCKLYAKNDYPGLDWADRAEALGLTEDELALQAKQQGLHLCLDVDKQWNSLHELLTGITLRERRDEDALLRAKPFIDQSKLNPAFPNRCAIDLEEARVVVRSVCRKLYCLTQQLEANVPELHYPDHECPENDVCDLIAALDFGIIYSVQGKLFSNLMLVAALQKNNDVALIKSCGDELMELAECANSLQSLIIDVPVNVRVDELSESLMRMAALIKEEDDYETELSENELNESAQCIKSTQLLITDIVVTFGASPDTLARIRREHDRLSRLEEAIRNKKGAPRLHHSIYFPGDPALVQLIDSMSDEDLLSLAVSGDKSLQGDARCLTVDQVQAIAKVLQPLTSNELATKHSVCGFSVFDEFKKFYLRAAQYRDAALVRWIY